MTAMAKPRHISATCRYYPSISRPRQHWPSLHWISACRKCTDLHGPALDARRPRRSPAARLVASAGAYSLGASLCPLPGVESFTLGLMVTWEITITCRDGSRLRLSEQRDHAPLKGDIFDTADTGQTIKARIDACHEENPSGWRHPFFQVTATEV